LTQYSAANVAQQIGRCEGEGDDPHICSIIPATVMLVSALD